MTVDARGDGVETSESRRAPRTDERTVQRDPGPAPAPAPVFRVMDVMSVTLDLPGQFPVVRLQEAEPPLRDLSFPVGMPEGVALSYAIRRLETPRPLTHELFSTVLQRASIDIVAVRIVGRTSGTYLAELDLMAARGREVVPCRPSDGIVLALRQTVPSPVLADERLLAGGGDVAPSHDPTFGSPS
ncbi:MAG: bifunctional nuclease family protein [Acidimicrobiales bacterium]